MKGYGNGDGHGNGHGTGYGYGYGDGDGTGYGYGDGDGYGITTFLCTRYEDAADNLPSVMAASEFITRTGSDTRRQK